MIRGCRTAIALALGAIASAPALARPPAGPADGGTVVLDIPYVPQSEALCGGAAVAMVLRYWGAPGVSAEEFSPLLQADGSGISVDRLASGVRARGWQVVTLPGTAAIARGQLSMRRPVIALISVGRRRFHYVVLTSWNDRGVIAHDPARAPDRVFQTAAFESAWAKAGRLMLVITPRDGAVVGSGVSNDDRSIAPDLARRGDGAGSASTGVAVSAACDRILASAIGANDDDKLKWLTTAVDECPASAAARRELAGYRLIHGSPVNAASLAAEAVHLDPADAHAWYLLGAARYLAHDSDGALAAWNQIGEPRLDLISVGGLSRSTYRSVADIVGVAHGALVTSDGLAVARRRIADLPAVAGSHVDMEPRGEGLAQIDVGVVERATAPRSWAELAVAGARAAIDREVTETFSNLNGTGDAWTAEWRWWTNRPRVGVGIAAPGLFGTQAIWKLDASWEAQTYLTGSGRGVFRSERTHGGLNASDWITRRWRWRAESGLERWNGTGSFWFGGVGIEHHSVDDRFVASAGATTWFGATSFGRSELSASWISRVAPRSWRVLAGAGGSYTTAASPFDLWNGGDVGHARSPLLRAHPLLDNGIVAGPSFGRAIQYGTAALERWPSALGLGGVGVAAFVDAVSAQDQIRPGPSWFVDAGAGLRIRALWLPGVVRIDYAHGLRDGANAVSLGWQTK